MSLLGEYSKQPVEVEIYGLQFVKDMAVTDQIESAWQIMARIDAALWNQVVITAPYTATLADTNTLLVSTADITVPVDAPDGYCLSVANQHQSAGIFVGSVTIPARGSTVLARINGAWIEEAKTHAVLVDGVGDQRVRVRVFGGTLGQLYKIQVTVSTSEGRTMQDEFTLYIEEI
jgi:hypothetical protein